MLDANRRLTLSEPLLCFHLSIREVTLDAFGAGEHSHIVLTVISGALCHPQL